MYLKVYFLLVFCFFSNILEGAEPITVLKIPSTKYNSNARLKITSPKILKKNSPILVLVSNFPIGVDAKSQALEELKVPINQSGSKVLLLFNNGKRVYVTKDDVNLLITQRDYFNKRFRVTIPSAIYKEIYESNFLIYSMLVNCYGETIKTENAFYTDVYSFGDEKSGLPLIEKQLKEPFIVYNEPYGQIDSGSVLLDFYVKNVIISSSEYKVDLYVDGEKIIRIYTWEPYVIKNLPKGKHDIRIELIDPSGKIVKNPISVNSSTVYVK
jgi:hypothetical protein